jgi:hypothetical protein
MVWGGLSGAGQAPVPGPCECGDDFRMLLYKAGLSCLVTERNERQSNRGKNFTLMLCTFPSDCINQRFPNWWVASQFVVGCEKCLKCDFFNYIKIKNHKKRESEKTKQN